MRHTKLKILEHVAVLLKNFNTSPAYRTVRAGIENKTPAEKILKTLDDELSIQKNGIRNAQEWVEALIQDYKEDDLEKQQKK